MSSQLSLMPAHVPADRPKDRAVERPLFDLDALDAAAEQARLEIANSTVQLRVSDEEMRECARRWAMFLRGCEGKNCVKKVCRRFAAAGVEVDERTVDGWISLSEPRLPGTNRHLLGAMLAYGPIEVLSVYVPRHKIVLAREVKAAEEALRDLMKGLPA